MFFSSKSAYLKLATASFLFLAIASPFARAVDPVSCNELAHVSFPEMTVEETAANAVSKRFLDEAQTRSTILQERLLAATKKRQYELYDTVIVGVAGVNGDIVANVALSNAPNLKLLGIDAGNGTSFTFDSDFFQLNSMENAVKGTTPLPYLPNQLKDLLPPVTVKIFPRARTLANGIHFGLASLDADILLNNRVNSIQVKPGYFLVKTSHNVWVKAKKVVFAPGYGDSVDSFLDQESRDFLKTSMEEMYQNKGFQGRAVHFDLLKHYAEEENILGTPIDEQLDSMDVLDVGSSDGGSVVMQWLTRRPTTGKRIWLGLDVQNGQGYIDQLENKDRYGPAIAPKIDAKEILPLPGRLLQVRPFITTEGVKKVKILYTDKLGIQKEVLVDFAAFALGYKKAPQEVLNGLIPHYFASNQDPEDEEVWNFIKEREQTYLTEHAEEAQKATPNLYSVGVDGRDAVHLLSVMRGGRLSTQVGKEIAANVMVARDITTVNADVGNHPSLQLNVPALSPADTVQPKIAFSAAKTRLLRILRGYRFTSDLSISFTMDPARLLIQLYDVKEKCGQTILSDLEADVTLLADLRAYFSGFPNQSGTVRITLGHTAGGGVRMDQATIINQ